MAFSVSATAVTASRSVLATISDFPASTVTWEAQAQYNKDDGWSRDYEVLDWTPQTGTGSTFTDFPPLNYKARYVVTALSSTGSSLGVCTSGEVLLAADVVHVMSVTASSGWDAQVVSDEPSNWEARSSWHTVIGRRQPVALVAPMLEQSGSITVRLADRAAFKQLRQTVDEGWPIRIRSGCERVWTNGVVLPLQVTWSPPIEGSVARMATIDYQTVLEYAVVRTSTDAAES